MVRWGRRCRRLRRRNNAMRAELTVLRTVVGQDHVLVQEHRQKESKLCTDNMTKEQAIDALQAERELIAGQRHDVFTRLERVPRWVRWLFGAA